MFLRTEFNYDTFVASRESGLDFSDDPGVAQQQFRDEVDINTIVKRFGLTGELPQNLAMPLSGDFTDAVDFHEAMNLVARANQEFMTVPAEIRARFNNDPGRLISFLEDGSNREEALKLGLIQPPPEKTRDVVTAVDELAKVLAPKP